MNTYINVEDAPEDRWIKSYTTSEVLQFFIKKLSKSSINYKNDRELFELIFFPIKYGNKSKEFEQNSKEKNYRSQFSYWKNIKNRVNIRDKNIINALEENFNIPENTFLKGENEIEEILKSCVDYFINTSKDNDNDKLDIIKILEELGLIDDISSRGAQDLEDIEKMNSQDIKQFLKQHKPLEEHRSQEFVLKLIKILQKKGYYLLLLKVWKSLDYYNRESLEVKKIKVDALSSSKVGEYEKAYKLLRGIRQYLQDDEEINDIETGLLSNMRRHELNNPKKSDKERKSILISLIYGYGTLFKQKNNYYPGINLAYVISTASTLFKDKIKSNDSISSIYKKAQKSISLDKKSDDSINRYYASMTDIEFMLLDGSKKSIHDDLQLFLQTQIPSKELQKTKRQMQFFISSVSSVSEESDNLGIKKAIQIIDDFEKMD